MTKLSRVCVFCGSRSGRCPAYEREARALGERLARNGIGVVYGGGQVGLMGVLADAALAAGGQVIGVIPKTLCLKEVAHERLTELRVVGTMHERKALMAELSDGFIALPGGLGTLEELLEVWTWATLGIHTKPCGLLNIDGYFDPMLQFIGNICREEFLKPEYSDMLIVERNSTALLQRLRSYAAPITPKYAGKESL